MPNPTPHPVDRHVGARIRLRRQVLKVSQTGLADALGLTFQQIQKYETGANRVAASTLHAAARALQTTPAWFFEGLPDTASEAPDDPAPGAQALGLLVTCPEGLDMASAVAALPRRRQGPVLALLRAIIGET